jgi:Protein of unknown function (DUF1552)
MIRGIGASMALPFLDAMIPAFATQRTVERLAANRMAYLYVPNGIVMDAWTPPGDIGSTPLGEFPRITRTLVPFRDDVLVLGGLTSDGGRAHGDGPGDHGRAGAAYLTGVHPKKTFGKDLKTGVSMDQIAARGLEGRTPLASLELGCEEGIQGGNCDNGYSCAYSNSISWRTESTPNPPEISPRAVFERMFGAADDEKDPAKRERQAEYRLSILDLVAADARRLTDSLGGDDRRKLDEYLSAVRDVERRIQDTERRSNDDPARALDPPAASIPTNFAEHARLMFDLVALAFQTDTTRVITVLLGIEQSPRNYPEIGLTEAHHGLTHHQGDRAKIEKVTQINEYHIQQFVYLLDKLKAIPDGDGTLLDNSMIVYAAGLADGNSHQHHNLPTVLAGRARGTLRPGRHVRYPDETPITNLYLSMLDRLGVTVESIGDSTGRLEGLSDG